MDRPKLLVASAAGLASAAVVYTAWRWYRNDHKCALKRPKNLSFKPVGKLSEICVHPVKSFRGQSVSTAEVRPPGLWSNGVYDRHFVLVDDNGRFVTMRQEPSLALVGTTVSDDRQTLILDAPGLDTIRMKLDCSMGNTIPIRIFGYETDGMVCAEEVNTWISSYLKKPGHKLAFFKDGVSKTRHPVDDARWGSRFTIKDKVYGYSDFSQFMLLSEASLDELNTHLDEPRKMKQFRPNLIVSGTQAYEEDNWKYVRIGEKVMFRRTHPCGRCKLTTVDPDTGICNDQNEPLSTLKRVREVDKSSEDGSALRGSPPFGANLTCEEYGTINVGDTVYASL